MPRTAASPHARGRILAVAGAAAALAGAGTAAAAGTASAATTPPAGFNAASLHHVLTTMPAPSPLAPATGPHGTAVTLTTTQHPAQHAARTGAKPAARTAAKVTPARHARHHAAHAAPARPYQMYDSVTPSAIPGGKSRCGP